MYNKVIQNIRPLGFMWPVSNPFIFCVHHLDEYPAGNEDMGPATSLAGRYLGQDFTLKDGWRMFGWKQWEGMPSCCFYRECPSMSPWFSTVPL